MEVVFTNRLKTVSLSVQKLVAGNMGDRDLVFSFRARLFTADPEAGGSALPFPESGEEEVRFLLKHGQTAVLEDIPIGAWVVVTEEAAEDYETHWRTEDGSGAGRMAKLGPVTAPGTLVYKNTREVLIDTGVTLDTTPFLLMTAAGTLPLLGRRRKRE